MTLREQIEVLPTFREGFEVHIDLGALLDIVPPNAILIAPTAPETVAALAEALHVIRNHSFDYSEALHDGPGHGHPLGDGLKAEAAAILPAFVARLRGER
jgi:hypothetical protein